MDDSLRMKLEGNWKQMKGRLREKWGELTDDEIDQTQGNWDQLVGKIQERTGQAREDIERELESMST